MQRDDEYIRKILFQMEEDEKPFQLVVLRLAPSAEEAKHWYHIQLLLDYGYAERIGRDSVRLTAQGHDYLNSIRDETIWRRTRAAVADTGGSATLEILKQLAQGFLKKKIAEHTGLEL